MTDEERARAKEEAFWADPTGCASAILAAVLEEREACARLADAAAQEPSGPMEYGAEGSTSYHALRKAREIAAAIRSRPA